LRQAVSCFVPCALGAVLNGIDAVKYQTRKILAKVALPSALISMACEDSPTVEPADTDMPAATQGPDAGSGSDGSLRPDQNPTGVDVTPPTQVEDQPLITQSSDEGPCVPTTCEELGFNCGSTSDACGGELKCGQCPEGQLCGGETPNVCLAPTPCDAASGCAELGWECGVALDSCGNTFDCAAEGLTCGEFETCIGGINGAPAVCEAGLGGEEGCDVCDALPDCDDASPTILNGRVITPGRDDANTGNQVGVPNAFVYILTNNDPELLPSIGQGIPPGETACDRCDGQDLGPVLAGATTDALGNFKLEGNIPVGKEFLLITKAGKFRRAVPVTLDEAAACTSTVVDTTQTRLPRNMTDGVAVNIPLTAISTGSVDAMECVFEKMGIDTAEFGVPGDGTNPQRIHLYGTDGAEMPEGNPAEATLFGDTDRVMLYDMLVFDCQGGGYLNPPPAAGLDNIREYVNRGGRMFASHLSFQWICRNGETAFSEADPFATGLSAAADFPGCTRNQAGGDQLGVGLVSTERPGANPAKIEDFAQWLVNENAAAQNADGLYEFEIIDPRELAQSVGDSSEEFVYRGDAEGVQQFSFNTPYGSPDDSTCGRVAYSGFHVAGNDPVAGQDPFEDVVFPAHCAGDLTPQEKVLLYMLFDLGACVGDPPSPPECSPLMCEDVDAECGLINDGCGNATDCGPCPPGEVCGLLEPNKCAACTPVTCDDVDIQCGPASDGCGGMLDCPCPEGLECGVGGPNICGKLGDPE
jgi:hypothetical protein